MEFRLERRRAWDSENCGKSGEIMGSETGRYAIEGEQQMGILPSILALVYAVLS